MRQDRSGIHRPDLCQSARRRRGNGVATRAPRRARAVVTRTVEFRILHARPRTHVDRLRIDGVDSLGLGPDEPGAGHLITVT